MSDTPKQLAAPQLTGPERAAMVLRELGEHTAAQVLREMDESAVNRISTPAMVFEIARSRTVTWRVQPPESISLCDRSNEYLKGNIVPLSVSGGQTESGLSESLPVLFGPTCCSFGRWWSLDRTCWLAC